jgi:phthalate 4,5-cis-dihydrodiol dehydrogenase
MPMPGVAVVGLGLAGAHMTAAIRAHPGVRLACAADPKPMLRDRFTRAEGVSAYADFDSVLADPSVDVVYLATPQELHRGQAVKAAASGKHVLVEKPMAPSAGDCAAMVAAAEQAQVVLMVGHTHGFDPGVRLIAELVQSGEYGSPALVAAWDYTNFLYRPRRPSELDPALGGGVVLNQVAHQVDLTLTILDRPVRKVRAVTTRLDPARPVDGSCVALLDFGGGVAANLVYVGYDHFDTDELHGWVRESGHAGTPRHGRARAALQQVDPGAEEALRSASLGYGAGELQRPDHQPHLGELVVSCARADLRLGIDDVLAYTDAGVVTRKPESSVGWPGYAQVLDELAAAVQLGRPAFHDGRFATRTIEVCEAILRSAATGSEVVLGPEALA